MARKKTNNVTVDFKGTDSGSARLPEGGYRLKVVEAEFKDNDKDGQIIVKVETVDGDSKKGIGKSCTEFFDLQPQSLWRLRNFLDALGVEVPDGPLDVDLDELTDLEYEATAFDDEYDGRTRTKFRDYVATSDDSSSNKKDEEEEENVKVSDRKKRARDEEDEDEAPVKSKKKSRREEPEEEEEEAPRKKKSRREEPEEEEEVEEAPRKKKGKDAEPGDEYTEEEVREMDEKELKSLIKKHDLSVDLDDYPTLRKQCMAVAKALDEEGLLTE